METERLWLRPLEENDIPDWYLMDSNPEVHRYLGNEPVTSPGEIKKVLEMLQQQYTDYGIGRWAVIEKETGKFAGWCGIKYFTDTIYGQSHFYELGYRFSPAFWGKGYATESSLAWIDYAKNVLKQPELFAITHPDNEGSQNVLKKCGFRFLGYSDTEKYGDVKFFKLEI